MSQQFYDIQKAAEVLGMKPADVQQLREQNKLRGFRDGASWKFKIDDVQNYLAESIKAKHQAEDDEDLVLGGADAASDSSDLNLTETEFEVAGSSDINVGATPSESGGSDFDLAGSDVNLGAGPLDAGGSDFSLAGSDINLGGDSVDSGGSDLELDLTLDKDVSLGDSEISLASEEKAEGGSDLEVSADVLDDDDLVLGGSGAGSDVAIGADSGISLVDPADSGLSLDEPLDLTAEDEESLELGEDDMLTLEETDSESPTEVQTDDEFLLTPLEEAGDEESGSQVIALDTEEESGVIADAAAAPAMLDEDFGGGDQVGFEAAAVAPTLDMANAAAAAAPVAAGQPTLAEAPYSGTWVWLGLFPCLLLLVLSGVMCFDLVRNMWTWNGTMTITSPVLDMLAGFIS